MPCSVICISHDEGADGREVGRLAAEHLGFRFVDDGIVLAAARSQRLFPEAVARAESRHAGRQLEVDFHRFEKTSTLRAMIRDAIVAAAEEGSVVILAHAASYALADRPGVLRVLVTGSAESRAQRLADAEGLDAKAAAKMLAESDKGRSAYLGDVYGVKHELPTHYDVVLNSDRLPAQAAAAIVAQAAA